MKNNILKSALALICLCAVFSFFPISPSLYVFNHENVLGTSFELKVSAKSEKDAELAEATALAETDRLNAILSTYDGKSEISSWQKTHNVPVKVSSELYEVFALFDKWQQQTNGSLTATAAVAAAIWKTAEIAQHLPSEDNLATAVKFMKEKQWELDPIAKTATHTGSQPLVLSSFVKSYIINRISEKVMRSAGIAGAVINIGGDIKVAGTYKEKVEIANPLFDQENAAPLTSLTLENRTIATSGNYRRGFRIGNSWFSHIINPNSGRPASGILSATVISSDATQAGALATTFNILTPEESRLLAEKFPGVEYEIITATYERITSAGWNTHKLSVNKLHISKPAAGSLTIDLELATFEGRFRRPFVAVWLENKNRETVKTLALWFNKPRWLPELKRWYGNNQAVIQDPSGTSSISSATRSPGKYSLSWDGLDAAGKAVPSGKYTVYIEAAREHGTYQLIKQEIDWNGKAKHFDLEAGTEISAAAIDIQKASGK